ncbi:MAG TPA: LemA family protein, partial [Bacillota bacterium]|nr:LemA family protein [Bacillota bacterium]
MAKGKFSILWVLLGIVVVAVVAYISIGNQLVGMEEKVNTAWSEVENQFQRRYDLIPNLVATVKGFTSHEQAIIDSVTEARAKLGGAKTIDEKI